MPSSSPASSVRSSHSGYSTPGSPSPDPAKSKIMNRPVTYVGNGHYTGGGQDSQGTPSPIYRPSSSRRR
ncbi:hypothetical protein NHJ13734_006273 [Beauveria thailandica]